VLRERVGQRGRVLEEDVDPDARVRARDPGHVAERAARREQRVVPVDHGRARLVDEQVGERVREMAREGDDAVVRVGVDRDRGRAETGDEAVHEPVALDVGGCERGQEPGRAVKELGIRVLGAAGLGAADRMAADEARRVPRRGADARLRRADVGDGAGLAAGGEHGLDLRAEM
jgi:hypothetical protein